MSSNFPEDVISLNTICKTYNQLYLEKHDLADHFHNDACRSCLKLLENDPKNFTALVTKAISLDKENKLLEAREIVTNCNFQHSTSSY